MLHVEFAYLTHPGLYRKTNQDNLICMEAYLPEAHGRTDGPVTGRAEVTTHALFGVFDGMGGEEHGEAASFIAARAAVNGEIRDMAGLAAFCGEANREICAYARKNRIRSSGTTASLLLFDGQGAGSCHIGDSRIYRLGSRGITQLTKDDVWPSASGRKNMLLQCLGIPEDEMRIRPHLDYYSIRSETAFLICTDGLTNMVADERIAAAISDGRDLKRQAQTLLDQALQAGGRDNITLLLIRAAPQ